LVFLRRFPSQTRISIYAAISEETGLAGGLAVLLALGVFVFAGTAISLGSKDIFTKLLARG
jgi:cell division protein FtsW (lipid II flippase)